jgi:uncharacterized protein (TIGR03437 family)
MNRTSCVTFTLFLLISGIMFAQAPSVPQGGVVSAASLLPLGAPGYQLSPGGIVSIFGTNLATSTVLASTIPLPTTLGGATVNIGGIAAPLYYASPAQINAQVPYTVTPGAAVNVTVTTSAGTSVASTIPVVAAAPGLFSVSQNGQGNAAAQNYVSATSQPANGFNVAIPQGNTLIAYGTGGGAVKGGPATGAACVSGTFNNTYSATIAGQSATVQYAGCGPTFVGLDQWNITVPTTIPDGCYLPLQVTVNGVLSNTVTISVASSGNCATAATGQPQVGAGQAYGGLSLSHTAFVFSGFNQSISSFSGTFQKNGAVAASGTAGFPPAGAGCLVQYIKSSSSTPPTATVTGTPLDAGTLTLKTPSSGNVTLPPNPIGTYSASSSPPTGTFPAITAGSYTISGPGGTGANAVGPFSAMINFPTLLNVTNPGFSGSSFSQAQNLSPTLTCPDPAGEILVEILSQASNGIEGIAICTFACGSNIVVPSSVLKQLPVSASGQAFLFFLFLAPNNNAGVTSKQFTATGLDFGLFAYTDIYGVGSLTLTP